MSARTSARLKARQTHSRQTGWETVAVPSSEHLKNTKPPPKRQKTTTANTKTKAVTKRGKGKNKKTQETFLIELPLDVLFEIFKSLQPLDLLNLSYTAKDLRSILTAEYAASIWKKSYTNVRPVYGELPPKCPSYVDIRHYTSVVFGRNCLFCADPDATIVHTSALTRLCNTCAQNELWVNSNYYHPVKRFAVTEHNISSDISRLCRHCQISNKTLKFGYYFLKREYERHASALQQCVNDEAQDRYVTVLRSKQANNYYASDKLERWCNAVVRQKAEELRLVLDARRRSIRMKLEEEGYTDLCGYNLEDFPGVKKVAPLTDKEWNKIKTKLMPALELYLQDEKKKRMKDAFTERLSHLSDSMKNSLESEPKPWIHAPLPSIAKLEPFASIVRDTGTNEDRELVKQRLSELADHIPALLTTCRAEIDIFLLGLLLGDEERITHVDGKDFDRTPLELATTFFKCHQCIEIDPISYPRILMHECLRRHTKLDAPSDEEPLVESYGIPIVTAQHVWNRMSSWYGPTWNETRQFISIDDDATRSATAIVLACGEDPKVFTAAALKERNVRLECMRCVPSAGRAQDACSRHIMSWNMAILHDISEHPNDISAQGWSLVTAEDDLARARKIEDKILRSSRQKLWEHCRYCDCNVRTNLRTFGAEDHLLRVHKISESEPEALKTHVYIAVDAPLDAYPCSVMI